LGERLKAADKSRDLCVEIARVLLERREACGFSQTKLAELSGLTRQMISFVEQSRRIPTVDTLARLARPLGVTPSVILSEAEKACRF
jgi:transcriptional regulator with XRE-family HTH domain